MTADVQGPIPHIFLRTCFLTPPPIHTGRSRKMDIFIICFCCCFSFLFEHPPWQQLFPFFVQRHTDVTLCLTCCVWTGRDTRLAKAFSPVLFCVKFTNCLERHSSRIDQAKCHWNVWQFVHSIQAECHFVWCELYPFSIRKCENGPREVVRFFEWQEENFVQESRSSELRSRRPVREKQSTGGAVCENSELNSHHLRQ